MNLNPICHPSPAKKWNAHFWIMLNFWWSAGLVNGLKPHVPPLSRHKMKCLFLDYIQLLMIGCDCGWTQTLCAIPLKQKKWNAHFFIMFNFWWSDGLVDGLKPHTPPLSRHKMKCSFLDYVQLLMIGRAGRWTWTPCTTLLQPKNWYAHFWITFIFWWSAGLIDGLEPHTPPFSSQIKWNAHFCIMFNFWWSAGLVNGLEPHPPPFSSEKMKCSFLDYVQLLMNGRAGRWNQTPSATCLQPKNEMLIFGLCSTSDDWWGWLMDLIPIHHPSPAKKWNAHFWIMFNFWWSAKLVNGLKPICHPSPG